MKLVLFGAGGSVGLQAVEVLSEINKYEVVAVSLDVSFKRNTIVLDKTKPEVALYQESTEQLEELIKEYPNTKFLTYNENYKNILKKYKGNYFFNALPGTIGISPLVEAINNNYKKIFLANKESLVMAGDLIKDLLKNKKTEVIPIDSEHYAILKLYNDNKNNIHKLIITASGGAVKAIPLDKFDKLTKLDILKHPIWNMGNEITVNSATMINKVYEVSEAKFYFNKPINDIEVYISPSGIVHGGVILNDSRILLNLSKPSMIHPIKLALCNDDIKDISYIPELTDISFSKVCNNRYPLFNIGIDILNKGLLLPSLLVTANSALVRLFLEDKISFLDISKYLKEILDDSNIYLKDYKYTIEDIIKLNNELYNIIYNKYKK